MDVLTNGLNWLSQQRRALTSATAIYRRPSTGQNIEIKRIVGQTQLVNVNPLSVEPQMQDLAQLAATTTNRDYIVTAADLDAIWPPKSGDLIDDANDKDGTINRYQVMALPGQNPWRWFAGGRQRDARIHTKFLATFKALWSDAFTGSDGTAIDDHTADSPAGGTYSGGSGDIEIADNRIVATSATAFRYFAAGQANATFRVSLGYDVTLQDLSGKVLESGIGLRCASSGAGLRDGYYCTLRLVAENGELTTRRLKIVERTGGVSGEAAGVNIPYAINLADVFKLQAVADGTRITLSLLDATGEVLVASAVYNSAGMTGQTAGAVLFDHHVSIDPSSAWMDDLEVEE